ncbi:MAG: DNA polymerase III subunit delta [Bacilli bacterium]|jgi:DNA polymerase-3 subunit delta'|nr:DNA polymerase III subunit delta [Bacilli bacterium]MCH4210159.1 DNA polymerase III subunit delta [Bacilli bacterium]MCH4229091.1 DNA polymerase III subunit delta [Bacilli bacterium]MCH4278257.1 DNA polymerase III subunit delta [Bacilli bacterium]MCI2055411.1 DNA polymerase III subunit delta [Bacilli bacterium]
MINFGAYLEKSQPIVYKTFSNALKNNRLSHAYLLSGEAGIPLKETAIYLAKSILCDHPSPLADETCNTCVRVDHGNYADLLILDGAESSLKKDSVQEIVSDFTKTPLEEKKTMIYIIHLVENMTSEAVNSLLKFLEEPTKNTYAFLTTQNEARLLPTIISRCESMRMLLLPREEVIRDATTLNVSLDDAELLSYFLNSGELISLESKSDDYLEAKGAFLKTLEALSKERSDAIFTCEHDILPNVSSKEDGRYYLDMLSLCFKDLISLRECQTIKLTSYATLLMPLANKLGHLEESLLEIMKVRGQLDLNISVSLLVEHLFNYITKEF